jgi:hypothetical protein
LRLTGPIRRDPQTKRSPGITCHVCRPRRAERRNYEGYNRFPDAG